MAKFLDETGLAYFWEKIKQKLSNKIGENSGDKVTLKDDSEGSTLEGYEYCSFGGGTIFNGKEMYAFRASHQHITVLGNYGEILFYERSDAFGFKKLDVELSYDSETYGELRDVNLSPSRDGSRLYVSCFTTIEDGNSYHASIIFVLNQSLVQIGSIVVPNTLFWGNTLETPDGYLLHADYYGNNVNLYKSSAAVTNDNAGSISMTKLLTLPRPGHACSEPTIGYFRDRLICITRTGDGAAACLAYTYDLSGETGWSTFASIGYTVHAPSILTYSQGMYLVYSGSILNRYITGNDTKRMPYIGLISTHLVSYATTVAGSLLDDKDTWGDRGYGGYTTLVKLDDSNYGVMYYNDNSSGASTLLQGLYFKKVNIHDLVTDYYTLEDSSCEVKLYSNLDALAYNNALIPWVVSALNDTFKSFDFVVNMSANEITDIPARAKVNNGIVGHAIRRYSYYFIRLSWYSNGHPFSAEVNLNSATSTPVWQYTNLFVDIDAEINGAANTWQYVTLPFEQNHIITSFAIVGNIDTSNRLTFMPPVLTPTSQYTRVHIQDSIGSRTIKLRCFFAPNL